MTTRPMSDAYLEVMRHRVAYYAAYDGPPVSAEVAHLASDRQALLAEVDRLRAENTAQAAELASMRDGAGYAVDAGVAYLQEVKRLEAIINAVRALPEIEIGQYWAAHPEAEATGRNATLLEVRRILDGGEPRRADRSQADVLRDFERDMRTVRALGLDQDGEGQA